MLTRLYAAAASLNSHSNFSRPLHFTFLVLATAAAAGFGAAATAPRTLPRRRFRDDAERSIIGFRGILSVGLGQREADRIVAEPAESMEAGAHCFDVAPSYGEGEPEVKPGPALRPTGRNMFSACKTRQRSGEGACPSWHARSNACAPIVSISTGTTPRPRSRTSSASSRRAGHKIPF